MASIAVALRRQVIERANGCCDLALPYYFDMAAFDNAPARIA